MIKQSFEQLSPEHKQVLLDIQKTIPLEWLQKVTKKVDIAPVSKEIMERALLDPEVDEETKKEFKLVLDSGYFNQQIDEEQDEVTQLINAFVEKEIIKAVAVGKLPKMKKKRSFEAALKRFNTLKSQYERNNQ